MVRTTEDGAAYIDSQRQENESRAEFIRRALVERSRGGAAPLRVVPTEELVAVMSEVLDVAGYRIVRKD